MHNLNVRNPTLQWNGSENHRLKFVPLLVGDMAQFPFKRVFLPSTTGARCIAQVTLAKAAS